MQYLVKILRGLLISIVLIPCIFQISAQEKHQAPMDLFTGKWSGNLWFQAMCFGKGYIVAYFEAKVKGIVILKRLPKNYIFKVRTPQAVLASKGIEFLTKVNGDTIITVLEGEVGFSDINGKNTVVARKNQTSTCQQGELPTNAVSINSNIIPK